MRKEGKLDLFLGRAERLTPLDQIPCKANWQAARYRYVLEKHGRAGVEDVSARLADPALRRAFVDPPPTMAWTNVGTVVAIDRAILDGPMSGDVARMRHFGAEIAKYDVPGLYRAFFRLGTPAFVMGKIPLVFNQYFRRGTIRVTPGPARAELTLEDIVLPYYLCEHGIAGWLDAMLELVRARQPLVRQARCVHRGDPACAWEASWRP